MNKTIWIIIGVVIIAAIVGVVVWQTKGPADQTTTGTTTATTETATPKTTWKAAGTAVKGEFADADTVKLAENSYRMYYSVQPEVQGHNFEVYSAVSTDGKTWTQEPGVRKTMATFPDVIKTADGKFRMYYQSAGVIKSATSDDGLSWKDEAGTRIDKTNDLALTFDNVAAPSVFVQQNGTVEPFYGYVMLYRGTVNEQYGSEPTPNKNTQVLLWATSEDGLVWVKKGLAVDTRNTTLYGLGDGPELFTMADDFSSMKLSFWSYGGVYWSDFADGTFSTPEKVFALAEATAMNKFPTPTPGDPVYAQFNDVWYMYYGQKTGIDYAVATTQ